MNEVIGSWKAYDEVSWKFLDYALARTEFIWRTGIFGCLTSGYVSVIN